MGFRISGLGCWGGGGLVAFAVQALSGSVGSVAEVIHRFARFLGFRDPNPNTLNLNMNYKVGLFRRSCQTA